VELQGNALLVGPETSAAGSSTMGCT
jgi:hypothetical protein